MKRSEYLQRAFDAYNEGRISEEVYDSMVMNADVSPVAISQQGSRQRKSLRQGQWQYSTSRHGAWLEQRLRKSRRLRCEDCI